MVFDALPDLAGETLERQSAPNYILRQRTIPMTAASAPSSLMAQGFSRLVTVEDPFHADELMSERSHQLCAELESGNLVVLPRSLIVIPDEHRSLLLAWKQASSPYHKNIAYRPLEDRLTGLEASEQGEAGQLRRILRAYSQRAAEFLSAFLPPYAGNWKLDYVSYRPIEEKARPARLHARNDLVHFDSFPTRPTNGARILRFFYQYQPPRQPRLGNFTDFRSLGAALCRRCGCWCLLTFWSFCARPAEHRSCPASSRFVSSALRRTHALLPQPDERGREFPEEYAKATMGVCPQLQLDCLHRLCEPRCAFRPIRPRADIFDSAECACLSTPLATRDPGEIRRSASYLLV